MDKSGGVCEVTGLVLVVFGSLDCIGCSDAFGDGGLDKSAKVLSIISSVFCGSSTFSVFFWIV